jgi:hypothetical protein
LRPSHPFGCAQGKIFENRKGATSLVMIPAKNVTPEKGGPASAIRSLAMT